MVGVVGQVLPIGLAAALSSVPITIMILILLSQRRKAASVPYLLGSVLGVVLVVTLTTLLAQALPESRVRQKDPITGAIALVVGAALIGLGIRAWLKRDRAGGAAPPRWANAVESLSPLRAFGIGVVLGFRPKSLLLAAVIGLQLHVGSLHTGPTIAVGVLYVVIATSTVTVPILATLMAPDRMEPRLGSASKMLSAELPVVSAVVLLLIGVVVIGAGLQNF